MPNEGPYGGKIEMTSNGRVVWQAGAREFPQAQDMDGTLEYAVRVIDQDRMIFGSGDGKFLVNIHPLAGTSFNVQTGAKSAVLIVSGYEEPGTDKHAVVVGKSYFVTGANVDETGNRRHVMPPYDVHLHYNDYDLDRAGKLSGQKIEEKDLTFCYQHWVSLRRIWRLYRHKPQVLLALDHNKALQLSGLPEWGLDPLDEDEIKFVVSWSRVYHHLVKLRIPASTLDELVVPIAEWRDETPDIWLSLWKRVKQEPPPKSAHIPEAVVRAPVRSGHGHDAEPAAGITPRVLAMKLGAMVTLVDGVLGQPLITDDDFHAWTAEDGSEETPISGIFVTGQRSSDIPHSRTIIVKGIDQPGTFALMYHGESEH